MRLAVERVEAGEDILTQRAEHRELEPCNLAEEEKLLR